MVLRKEQPFSCPQNYFRSGHSRRPHCQEDPLGGSGSGQRSPGRSRALVRRSVVVHKGGDHSASLWDKEQNIQDGSWTCNVGRAGSSPLRPSRLTAPEHPRPTPLPPGSPPAWSQLAEWTRRTPCCYSPYLSHLDSMEKRGTPDLRQ